ncbi:H-NS histone family protein [Alcanivorax sp. VBW004]|jgi:DNA-binding protein H-NS|uniref:H-NS histone family protein n=1 Tax=Gammaproteobacteria TaxID=1236 RepID=UPI00017ED6FF|nr:MULTISPECIES: H-NS histone family protein [Gammaproteobacteria]EDX89611.1 H-NS histone family [Alcanivorax sp. DG881]MBQ23822.1 DNA-binding protein [Alcanivorax sp.]MDC9567275.1 H-NS histone family protein [Pseudoalteromonas sp. GAB2316C]MTT51013.1 H-NS histone family protein [Alcanivorax sp. VBW004]|tara:strand:+ start:1009 stop:1365 length:357 start_codon:yes stop_codon:yes gene_type:complete
MSINLDELSVDELEKLIKQAESALDKKRKAELKNAQAVLEKMAKDLGVDPQDLLKNAADKKKTTRKKAAKKKTGVRRPAKVKFRDPNNSSNTWTGRGKRPLWLQDALSKGANLDDFLV